MKALALSRIESEKSFDLHVSPGCKKMSVDHLLLLTVKDWHGACVASLNHWVVTVRFDFRLTNKYWPRSSVLEDDDDDESMLDCMCGKCWHCEQALIEEYGHLSPFTPEYNEDESEELEYDKLMHELSENSDDYYDDDDEY